MQIRPFSDRPRGLVVAALPDGFGYGFDFDSPSGVKLIPPVIFEQIEQITDRDALRVRFPDLFRNPRMAEPGRLSVWLHVINACNFVCHYCYVPHLRRSVDPRAINQHSFGKEKLQPLIDNLIVYCSDQKLEELHVIFAGGEPTLNLPLVEEFCRKAINVSGGLRITFGMISNGSFDSAALLPLLSRYEIRLSISIDGVQNSHDRIRFELDGGRRVGSWRKLMGNIDLLLSAGRPPYLLYTVTPGNFREIIPFARQAHGKKLGFRLSLVRTQQVVTSEIRAQIAEELGRFYDELGETLSPRMPIPRYAAFAEWDLYRKKHVPCSSCRNYFAVGSDGGVASCQMRMDETYGDARSEPFGRIVARMQSTTKLDVLARPASKQGACVRCEYFHVCGGGCPQHTALAFGSMDQPSPWCDVFGSVIPKYLHAVARQLQRAVTVPPV